MGTKVYKKYWQHPGTNSKGLKVGNVKEKAKDLWYSKPDFWYSVGCAKCIMVNGDGDDINAAEENKTKKDNK